MRRQRNKIAALTADHRYIVMTELLNGHTYDEIRELLKEAGVSKEDMPGNSSFLAYRNGTEYQNAMSEFFKHKSRARNKKIVAMGLEAGGGISAALESGLYASCEKLVEELEAATEAKDVVKISRAIVALKIAIIADKKQKMDEVSAEEEKRLKSTLNDTLSGMSIEERTSYVQDQLDAALGLK